MSIESRKDRQEDDDDLRQLFQDLRQRLQSTVVGQPLMIDRLVLALLSDGHVLLEGAPGLAKTRVARALADSFEGRFNRVQFTPDLMPQDLTGSAIFDPKSLQFEFRQGPIFTNFLLADEINRAPAKVQSALLEAMEERQVTSGDTTYPLAQPFFVIATQNPIEHEGTWDLPEAQLDRFLMHVRVGYPDAETESALLDMALAEAEGQISGRDAGQPVDRIAPAELAAARHAVLRTFLSAPVQDYIVRLVDFSRRADDLPDDLKGLMSHPLSPRGSIALARVAKAAAWLAGREHVLPDDVLAHAPNVLRHRIGLSHVAEAEGIQADVIVARLIRHVPPI
ncbi:MULTISPECIES: AAA family ATPase [unclassified Minwuia]|uniref:AAA family ATPase n=1 Tax=unclassified Minwuia TaxID=2618799 RepID=UPI002478FD06|nr:MULTISPECIES: AAA family ATPase [unclassified Minwuia]